MSYSLNRPLNRLVILIAILTLTGAQCISFGKGKTATGAGGGVFISVNRGEEWQHKVAMPTAAGIKNFGGANVVTLAFDPQDHRALYVGTRENGLLYSYDGGEGWQQPEELAKGFVAVIAIDPRNKCTIYAATGNRILKSRDCNRTFEPIYQDANPQTFVSALAINPVNTAVLYTGLTTGQLLKSIDGGVSWARQADLKSKIVDLVLDPRNPTVLYGAVGGRGVWKSTDEGRTFVDLSESFKTMKDAKEVRRLVVDRATGSALLLASRHKLLRTTDGGATWTALPIISPENVEIKALAVNPRNSKEIYYGTSTTFYRSLDGGERWSTEKLPTKREASALLVNPEEGQVVYLGVLEVKQ